MPFKDIYNKSSLDRAFTVAYNNTRCSSLASILLTCMCRTSFDIMQGTQGCHAWVLCWIKKSAVCNMLQMCPQH